MFPSGADGAHFLMSEVGWGRLEAPGEEYLPGSGNPTTQRAEAARNHSLVEFPILVEIKGDLARCVRHHILH